MSVLLTFNKFHTLPRFTIVDFKQVNAGWEGYLLLLLLALDMVTSAFCRQCRNRTLSGHTFFINLLSGWFSLIPEMPPWWGLSV